MDETLHKCEFCDKEFTKESTLFVHSCTKKIRWFDKTNKNSIVAFRAFQRFHQLSHTNSKKTTFKDFIDSQFYNGFIKFARWVNDADILYPDKYIEFVIKGSYKLDDWAKSKVYEEYLRNMMLKEDPLDALERSIFWMQSYCDENNIDISMFFEHVSTNRLTDNIRSNRISAWMFFLSNKGAEKLSTLDEGQMKLLNNILDPKIWSLKLNKYKNVVSEYQQHLSELGL